MAKGIAAAIASMGCGLCLAHSARAQCDYGLTTYESSELLASGFVYAMTVFDDGSGPALVVAGWELLPVPGESGGDWYNIAKWTLQDGWTPMAEPNELEQTLDLEVFEGDLYATDSGGPQRWTGAQWVLAGEGLIGWAKDVVVFDDGSGSGPALFITTEHNPTPTTHQGRLFKLDDGAWREVALFNERFMTTEVFGGRLFVSGGFTSVNGVPVNHIAAWDGRNWSDLGVGIDIWVSDLIEHEIDDARVLVACGSFTLDGGVETDMAYWHGSLWHALPEISVPNQDGIGPMCLWDNGDGVALHVSVTNKPLPSGDNYDILHRFDAATQQWQALAGTYRLPYSRIDCLMPYHEGNADFATLFVGGLFERFGTSDSYNLARILPQPSGAIVPIPSDPRALRGGVEDFAAFDDGNGLAIYAGGRLRGLGDVPLYTLVARFDGDSWRSIGRGNQPVHTLKTLDDGTGLALYAAGSFYDLQPNNGAPVSYFARLDGTSWIGMGTPNSSRVSAIRVHDDGSGPAIYGTLSNDTVVRWNGPGTWTAIPDGFTAAGTFGASLHALVSFDDGSGPALYVGGRIDAVGGVPASNIARWRGPSGGWEPVGPGLPGEVTMLHVHDDGSGPRLIATGNVGQPGGLAQWDGQAWSAVGNLQSIGWENSIITAITTFDDGSGPALIVSKYDRMARWNGSFWALLPQQGAAAFLADGDVLYMGQPFSIWAPGGEPLSISDQSGAGFFDPGDSTTLQVNIVHGGAVTYQWRHNGSPVMNVSGYSGAFSDRLRINSINGSHEGVYDVVVSNDCTSVISEPIEIDVIGTCIGDITVDGAVDSNDVFAVIGAWGACVQFPPCTADLTHDGAVDVDDLIAVILAWGPCP